MHGLGNTESQRKLLCWILDVRKYLTLICGHGPAFDQHLYQFLEQAGLNSSYALDFTLGKQGINMAGVFGSWFLMSLGIGRRSLYLYGLCGLCIMLLVIGFLGIPGDRHAASLATGSMMLIWAAVYQLTVGTVRATSRH